MTSVKLIALPVLTAAALICATAAAAPAASTDERRSTAVTVSSLTGWQSSGIRVTSGELREIRQTGGRWTADRRSFSYVDGEGYTANQDAAIFQGCKLHSSWMYGVLLARIGDGPALRIGRAGTVTADRGGILYLRIHDDDRCLGDNAGSLTIDVTPGSPGLPAPAPPGVLYSADWSNGLNGWAGGGSWKTLDGKLLNDGTDEKAAVIIAPFAPGSVRDYAVEADLRIIARRPGWWSVNLGLIARLDTDGRGYAAGVDTRGGPGIAPADNIFVRFAEGTAFDPQAGWHRYRLQVRGNEITLLADGAVLATVTDNRWLAGGRVGMWSWGSQLEIRSFSVSAL